METEAGEKKKQKKKQHESKPADPFAELKDEETPVEPPPTTSLPPLKTPSEAVKQEPEATIKPEPETETVVSKTSQPEPAVTFVKIQRKPVSEPEPKATFAKIIRVPKKDAPTFVKMNRPVKRERSEDETEMPSMKRNRVVTTVW